MDRLKAQAPALTLAPATLLGGAHTGAIDGRWWRHGQAAESIAVLQTAGACGQAGARVIINTRAQVHVSSAHATGHVRPPLSSEEGLHSLSGYGMVCRDMQLLGAPPLLREFASVRSGSRHGKPEGAGVHHHHLRSPPPWLRYVAAFQRTSRWRNKRRGGSSIPHPLPRHRRGRPCHLLTGTCRSRPAVGHKRPLVAPPPPPASELWSSTGLGQPRPMQTPCNVHRAPKCMSCRGHEGVWHSCSWLHEGHP